MTTSPQPTPEPNILGNFASAIGLFSIALFFTGWIYRWSYFSCFQLNVITLDLPVESFFIVPLQVFFADGWTIVKSALFLLLTALAIYNSLWFFNIINTKFVSAINWLIAGSISFARTRRLWRITRILNSWQQFNVNRYNSIKLLRSLIDEIIIVGWVLLVLFWSAYHQGIADARRDAGENSTLPAVALIGKQDNISLGRKLDNVFQEPSRKDYKFIGDKGLFDDWLDKADTDTSNPKEPRVWRLLLERGNWIYLFPALTKERQKDPKARPPVIAIQQSQSGDHLLIVSPEPSKLSK